MSNLIREALQAWVNRKKILTRWPCFYCGRTGPNESLKTVTITREDGQTFESGCDPCNDDRLIDVSETALDQFPSETPAAPKGARYLGPRFDTNDLSQMRGMVDLLHRCWEYMDDHADVVDNPNGYGEVAPNQAMQLSGELRQLLERMGHPVE